MRGSQGRGDASRIRLNKLYEDKCNNTTPGEKREIDERTEKVLPVWLIVLMVVVAILILVGIVLTIWNMVQYNATTSNKYL